MPNDHLELLGGAASSGGQTIPRRRDAAPLKAPTRNRYFYGKLLDVYHLELEQRYFLEQRRRLNRLTVGYGVVCGLDVKAAADGKGVVITPGFAIDGLGREIVVTEPIHVADPSQLTDDCGRPTETAAEGSVVTLCLAYHECETEPTPVLVSDCDVRETCTNGAVRERYALLVHAGAPRTPPYQGQDILGVCRLLTLRVKGLAASGGTSASTHGGYTVEPALNQQLHGASPEAAVPVASHETPGFVDLGSRGTATLPGFFDCAVPAEDCVVLATVKVAESGGKVGIDPWTNRRIVLSNDRLFEALLCLAEAVEKCCGDTKGGYTVGASANNPTAGKPNVRMPGSVVVEVADADGKPVANEIVTFAITSKLGGSFKPAERKTNAKGEASVVWTLGSSGEQTAVATITDGTFVDLTATAKD